MRLCNAPKEFRSLKKEVEKKDNIVTFRKILTRWKKRVRRRVNVIKAPTVGIYCMKNRQLVDRFRLVTKSISTSLKIFIVSFNRIQHTPWLQRYTYLGYLLMNKKNHGHTICQKDVWCEKHYNRNRCVLNICTSLLFLRIN